MVLAPSPHPLRIPSLSPPSSRIATTPGGSRPWLCSVRALDQWKAQRCLSAGVVIRVDKVYVRVRTFEWLHARDQG